MSRTEKGALGALTGLSLGDALGMPTQSMSPAAIHKVYGRVDTLRDAIAEQPIAPGMPAGSVTDDTEQALIVAELIIEGKGHIDPKEFAKRLLSWEDDMKSHGSLDLLGPSTKLALEQVRRGADIMTTGRTGTTNGAAMRVTPVGIANRPEDAGLLANRIYESCQVTHDTVAGFQSAALIATTVSLGLEGMTVRQALKESLRLVPAMKTSGAWTPKASVPARARQAIQLSEEFSDETDFEHHLIEDCGTSVEANESVAAAFALAWRFADDPQSALFAAVNLGGDTDTIAAMTGAMTGACTGPEVFDSALCSQVASVSHLDLQHTARGLIALRQ